MKILMVCLGNICRSPLAEGIMRHKVVQAGLPWTVDSAGTGGYHVGCAPHKLSQKISLANGIDISAQVCRQLIAADLKLFDRLYVMDQHNYQEVRRIAGPLWSTDKVDLLLNEAWPGENREVPDPYWSGEDTYHKVFNMISLACDRIIERFHEHS